MSKEQRPYTGTNETAVSTGITSGRSESLTPQLSAASVNTNKQVLDADAEKLAKLGYKQEFKREFGLWSSFSVSFALLGLLPSIASTLDYGIGTSGSPGITYGWIVAMVGIQCVAMSMGELSSSLNCAGGLYYSSAVLAPPGYGPITAWITGWSNWLVLVTSSPSIDYGLASMLLSLKTIKDPDYVPQNYQIFLVTCAMMILQSFISSAPTKSLARFNSFGTILNGVALFVVIIIILAANHRSDPKFNNSADVWGKVTNQTDWPDGVAVLMAFSSILWTMSGYDSSFHLAEECSNSAINTPWAIVLTSISGGLLGWALQLTIAYTVTSLEDVMDSSLGQPFVTYLQQVLSPSLVYFVTALTIVSAFFMGQASMIGASRVTYAYSRDGCFPFSSVWAHVNKKTDTPVNAVWGNCAVGICILCLIFAGDIAIGAIFSVGAIAAYVAFTIPVAMKILFSRNKFKPGPWHLGKFSTPIGIVSVVFVAFMVPILCLPNYKGDNLTASEMNWTVVVYFGPMLLSVIWYMAYARKFFKGPKVSFDHVVHDGSLDGLDVQMNTPIVQGYAPHEEHETVRNDREKV